MEKHFLKVLEEIKENLKNKKVLLACSTGVDSMVLLNLLEKAIPACNIVIAHVNHGKRTESILEEEFIVNYSKEHNIECVVMHLEKYTGNNFQSWARNKRYEFFNSVASIHNIDTLLLAHHGDDNLETILMRICRSSSLEGYGGIKKFTKNQNLNIYRPLLDVTKDDILSYASTNNIKYFEDSSNATDDYLRNRIRHHIIPCLKEENPSLIKAINIYSNTIFEVNDIIENFETNFIKSQEVVYTNNEYFAKVKLEDYLALSHFLKEQVMFRLLKPFSLSKECIKEIIKKIDSNKSNIVTSINNELYMIKEYGYVIFTNQNKTQNEFYLEITKDGTYIIDKNTNIVVDKNICYFNTSISKLWYNINNLPIIIRTRKNGDKIKRKNGTISVSDYLTNKKVPYLDRAKTLILCDDKNQPIAILGYIVK